jgi:GlpG protein
MRLIGELETVTLADRFADAMLGRGIRVNVEQGESGWLVWVLDDDHAANCRHEFAAFQQNPEDPRFVQLASNASQLRKAELKRRREFRKNYVPLANRWRTPTEWGPVIVALFAGSIWAAVQTSLGSAEIEELSPWLISTDDTLPFLADPKLFWKLFSPCFLHFGAIHLIFNLCATKFFGQMIEHRLGSWWFLLLVLITGGGSNLLQFYFSGPLFGGMSGVAFGLIGFLWAADKFGPRLGLSLDWRNMYMAMGWMVFGFIGLLGPIANAAHLGGFVIGLVCGWLAGKFLR